MRASAKACGSYLGVLFDEECVCANLEQPLLKGLISCCPRHSIWHHCHQCIAAIIAAMESIKEDVRKGCAANGMPPTPLMRTELWQCLGHLLQRPCMTQILATTAQIKV